MHFEIERKFLVSGDFKSHAIRKIKILQGYLSSAPERNVRIRLQGDQGFITIKGESAHEGISRFEWEKEISPVDAQDLLKICEPGIIEKMRYFVPEASGLMFEVDEFYGENKGLVIAEIELNSENQPFEKPDWLGHEVSGDLRYYNSMLLKKPYKNWV